MQIEAGKYYRTRDGRKVGPMVDSGGDAWPFSKIGTEAPCWTRDGHLVNGSQKHDADLIAEWRDQPNYAPGAILDPDGPVQYITKRKILPGTYGKIGVGVSDKNAVRIGIVGKMVDYEWFTAEDLVSAAKVLTDMAEAIIANRSAS